MRQVLYGVFKTSYNFNEETYEEAFYRDIFWEMCVERPYRLYGHLMSVCHRDSSRKKMLDTAVDLRSEYMFSKYFQLERKNGINTSFAVMESDTTGHLLITDEMLRKAVYNMLVKQPETKICICQDIMRKLENTWGCQFSFF